MANLNVVNKENINPGDWVNLHTGEIMSDVYKNVTSVNKVNSDLSIVSSEEFVVVDSTALTFIAKNFNNSDLANILKMSNMVYGTFNALYDKTEPHTVETLQIELDYSVNKFRDFLKRLYNYGIISILSSKINGVDKKMIFLNPNVARKSKGFDKQILKMFHNFDITQEVLTSSNKISRRKKFKL